MSLSYLCSCQAALAHFTNRSRMAPSTPPSLLEEGEIVDADDLEDISDNSIIEPSLGKSLRSSGNLRAHSLSSDSLSSRKRQRRARNLRHRCKRRKRRHLTLSDSDNSDAEAVYDLSIKNRLKEAVQISHDSKKNDLQTRLRAMVNNKAESVLPAPDIIAIETETPEIIVETEIEKEKVSVTEKNDDPELENLRMEALKTAVLNKHQKRKKKKVEQESHVQPPDNNNKENQDSATVKDDQKSPEIVDEDVDILRADLLVDMVQRMADKKKKEAEIKLPPQPVPKVLLKKIQTPKLLQPIKRQFPTIPVTIKPPQNRNPVNKVIINSNLLTNKNIVNVANNNVKKILLPKPVVKPLIINVNGDSDSDNSICEPPQPKVADINIISNTVDKFLKVQRAKFESQLKKNPSLLEKSAVKLLPKSQQIEYQSLLRRLKTAERRNKEKRLRQRLGAKVVELKPLTVEVELQASPVVEEQRALSEDLCKDDGRKSGVINELTTLKRTLREIRSQRNGSLQIKGKYQVLTPIMKKITGASHERKKNEQRIKNLLQQLKEAKQNLAQSHQKFSTYVKELVNKKAQIDEESAENGLKLPPVTSTPIKELAHSPTLGDSVSTITNHECEDMDICNSDETDVQIDIVDPNDIDQIFTRRKPTNNIPEYVSPLNLICDRYNNMDPHGIMCPYEVNGSCRDSECTYKHYLKNGER